MVLINPNNYVSLFRDKLPLRSTLAGWFWRAETEDQWVQVRAVEKMLAFLE
jgi:hypothetical protein